MTTEFESFSARISTTEEGKVQPEIIVVERAEKLGKNRLEDIVNHYSDLVAALKAAKFDISSKIVVSEVEQMKDWTKFTVKSSDPKLLKETIRQLRQEAQ